MPRPWATRRSPLADPFKISAPKSEAGAGWTPVTGSMIFPEPAVGGLCRFEPRPGLMDLEGAGCQARQAYPLRRRPASALVAGEGSESVLRTRLCPSPRRRGR
jgi:hypothetical protein